MSKPNDDLLVRDALGDICFRRIRRRISILDLEGHFIRTAMLRPAQGADGAGDAGIQVRAGAGNDSGGEGRGVELMFGIQVQRGMHGAHPTGRRLAAVKQVQEMRADGVIVRLHLDAAAAL